LQAEATGQDKNLEKEAVAESTAREIVDIQALEQKRVR